jgi:hypothetical protein
MPAAAEAVLTLEYPERDAGGRTPEHLLRNGRSRGLVRHYGHVRPQRGIDRLESPAGAGRVDNSHDAVSLSYVS